MPPTFFKAAPLSKKVFDRKLKKAILMIEASDTHICQLVSGKIRSKEVSIHSLLMFNH